MSLLYAFFAKMSSCSRENKKKTNTKVLVFLKDSLFSSYEQIQLSDLE